jgi:hypothetical protein
MSITLRYKVRKGVSLLRSLREASKKEVHQMETWEQLMPLKFRASLTVFSALVIICPINATTKWNFPMAQLKGQITSFI